MRSRFSNQTALSGVLAATLLGLCAAPALAQGAGVTYERLLNPDKEPQNWLQYHRSYNAQRFSPLADINRDNVKDVHLAFALALAPPTGNTTWPYDELQGTPIVVDGDMYVTDGWSRVYKLDVRSGKRAPIEWIMDPSSNRDVSGEPPANRGVAIIGTTVYSLSLDGRLIATNGDTGEILWQQKIQRDPREVFTMAPLPVKDMLMVGAGGGNSGSRDYVEARRVGKGDFIWRTFTIPAPGEPGSETWKDKKDNWKNGGGSIWNAGAFEPESNLTFWGTGNPFPDFDPASRPGDNLFANSVLALDADTGKMRWYFQYTPNESWDYDEIGQHVLVDVSIDGQARKLITHFGRNGIYYGLDRTNGSFVNGAPFVDKITWTKGLDPKTGKPVEYDPSKDVQTYNLATRPGGDHGKFESYCPSLQGGTNYFPVSYSPMTGHLYAVAMESCAKYDAKTDLIIDPKMTGSVVAVDPTTGKVVKKRETPFAEYGGALATAGGLVMSGQLDGSFDIMDADSLDPLWTINLGAGINAPPMAYAVNGKEYIALEVGGGPVPGAMFNYAARGTDPDLVKNQQTSAMLYVFTR